MGYLSAIQGTLSQGFLSQEVRGAHLIPLWQILQLMKTKYADPEWKQGEAESWLP